MNINDIQSALPAGPGTVLHWFDFICPFCYVGQARNQILSRHGLEAESVGARLGVRATSTWLIAGELVSGLRPESEFEALARQAMRQAGRGFCHTN